MTGDGAALNAACDHAICGGPWESLGEGRGDRSKAAAEILFERMADRRG